MHIEWETSFSVNVKLIDDQHKHFIDVLNEAMEIAVAMEKGQRVLKIMLGLKEYVEVHFQTEEKYFKEFAFEGAAEHIVEHDKFRKRFGEEMEKMDKDEPVLTVEFINYMEAWLANHLLEMDKQYVKCFNEHGLY